MIKRCLEPCPFGSRAHNSCIHLHTRYPWRNAVKLLPSDEHEVSIESFLGIARHQIASLLDKSGMLDRSEKSRVNTTLAWRWPSKNSVPHFIQFSAFCRTISPA